MGQMKLSALTVQNHWAVDDGHYVFDDPSSVPYTHIEILGKGQRGVVDKVKDTRTNLVYARKTYKVSPRSRRQREIDRQEYRREIEITRRLAQHRHVVHIVASYSTEDTLAVILEPVAEGGDLKTFLAQYAAVECPGQKALMLKTIHRAYGCLASGLAFMHARRIRHRDIKPENILIHANSVMYTDFGVSRDYSDRADSATEHYPGPFTRKYCAPEVQDQGTRTSKTDVFSLGIVFLLLYTAVWPSEVLEIVAKYRFYEHLETIRDELDEWMEDKDKDHEVVVCLRGMLMEEEKERLSANEVLGVLMRDETKYMCEGCQEETSMLTRAEDLTSLGGGGGVVKTHTTISTHVETKTSVNHQSKLQEQSTAPSANNLQRTQSPLAYSQELVSCQSTSQSPHSRHDSVISEAALDTRSPHSNPALSPSSFMVQATHLETTRSWYGIYQHKMVRTLRTSSNTSSPTNAVHGAEEKECVLYEDRIYDWEMKRLGFGIRLSKRKPFGSILPSLHMFPIVPYFSYEIDLIFDGTLFEVQQALATGRLHPYVQNEAGENLLHLAVRANRLDIGTLLHQCGVPATPTHSGRSLFLCATQNCQFFPVDRVISCLRFLLSTCDHQPDFTNPTWIRAQKTFFWDTEVTDWLFTSGIEYGLDRAAVEELCLRVTLRTVGLDPSPQMEKLEEPEALMRRYMITENDVRMQMEQADRAERVESLMRRYMTPNLVSRIKRSEMSLVADLFDREYYEPPLPFSPTFVLGALWLKVLSSFSIDLVTYLLHELDAYPNGLIPRRSYDLKIIAGLSEGGQFVLGWRIAMEHTPGFPLVSEFNDLGVEMEIGEWPYAEWGEGGFDVVRDAEEKRMMRFQRRVDRKAKKEGMEKGLSNAGEVPGSWIE